MKTARKLWRLNEGDNRTLDNSNLEVIADRIEDDYKKEERTYIFEDGSKLIVDSYNNWKVRSN